jgi:hypothetical protein
MGRVWLHLANTLPTPWVELAKTEDTFGRTQFEGVWCFSSNLCKQPLHLNLHAAEGEPFLAQVLQRGADMVDGIVDAEEAVVSVS